MAEQEIRKVYDTLESVSVDEVWKEGERICVQIRWGDWKHDHLRCDWLMKGLNMGIIGTPSLNERGMSRPILWYRMLMLLSAPYVSSKLNFL